MRLSDSEQKLVVRLRKRKQSFARWRWLILLTSVFCIGVATYCFSVLSPLVESDSAVAAHAAFAAPVIYVFLGIGVWLMVDTLFSWHGRAEVDLLLKLIEESQESD